MSGERGTVVALIHGSGHRPEHWLPLQEHLRRLGHDAIALSMPTTRPGATYKDYSAAAAKELERAVAAGRKIRGVFHSGGSNVAPGLVELLGKEAFESMVHLSGSFGKPSGQDSQVGVRDPIDLLRTRIPAQRSTDEFQRAIETDEDGLTNFDRARVRDLFFNDCPDRVAEWAIGLMRPHVRPEDEPPLEAHRQPNIPQWYMRFNRDRIRNPEWAAKAADSLGMTLVDMEGGHSPAISRPGELAVALSTLWDSVRGNDEPVTAELQLPASHINPQ